MVFSTKWYSSTVTAEAMEGLLDRDRFEPGVVTVRDLVTIISSSVELNIGETAPAPSSFT